MIRKYGAYVPKVCNPEKQVAANSKPKHFLNIYDTNIKKGTHSKEIRGILRSKRSKFTVTAIIFQSNIVFKANIVDNAG